MASNELTVAYPGREGAHSAAACDRLFPAARLVPLPTFSDVVEAVAPGRVPYGVLPIESSLVGPVAETHDLLYESPLSIVGRGDPARQPLPRRAPRSSRSRRSARSTRHPVALDQCRRLARLAAGRDRGRGAARPATRPSIVAELGRPVRRRDRERPGRAASTGSRSSTATSATTRRPTPASSRSRRTRGSTDGDGHWRTAFSFTTDHRPGALVPRARAARAPRDRPQPARLAPDPLAARSATASTPSSAATRSTPRSSPTAAGDARR